MSLKTRRRARQNSSLVLGTQVEMNELVKVSHALAREVDRLHFAAPVTHVYNPLVYARALNDAYLERFARRGPEALFLGMNPGPFGMAQSGVPFGDTTVVREWLGLEGQVKKPAIEHPKRPVDGLACTRSEVSGTRFWGWAKDRFRTPEPFFQRFFVFNYCPLVFMEASGRNRTPDQLPVDEQRALFAVCDAALVRVVALLEPKLVVGIGGFALARASRALAGTGIPVGTILHPSPASPAANRGWAAAAERQMVALGLRF